MSDKKNSCSSSSLITYHLSPITRRKNVSNQTDAHGREEKPFVPRGGEGEAVEARRRLRRERRVLQPDARAGRDTPRHGARQLLARARRAADRHRPAVDPPPGERAGRAGGSLGFKFKSSKVQCSKLMP